MCSAPGASRSGRINKASIVEQMKDLERRPFNVDAFFHPVKQCWASWGFVRTRLQFGNKDERRKVCERSGGHTCDKKSDVFQLGGPSARNSTFNGRMYTKKAGVTPARHY